MVCDCCDQVPMVEEAVRQCVEHVKTTFFYEQSVSYTGAFCMCCFANVKSITIMYVAIV